MKERERERHVGVCQREPNLTVLKPYAERGRSMRAISNYELSFAVKGGKRREETLILLNFAS